MVVFLAGFHHASGDDRHEWKRRATDQSLEHRIDGLYLPHFQAVGLSSYDIFRSGGATAPLKFVCLTDWRLLTDTIGGRYYQFVAYFLFLGAGSASSDSSVGMLRPVVGDRSGANQHTGLRVGDCAARGVPLPFAVALRHQIDFAFR